MRTRNDDLSKTVRRGGLKRPGIWKSGVFPAAVLAAGLGISAAACRNIPAAVRYTLSVTLRSSERQEALPDEELVLFRAGTVVIKDGRCGYVLDPEAAMSGIELTEEAREDPETAKRLFTFFKQNGTEGQKAVTDPDGTAVFELPSPGLYLAAGPDGGESARMDPFLVAVREVNAKEGTVHLKASPKVRTAVKGGSGNGGDGSGGSSGAFGSGDPQGPDPAGADSGGIVEADPLIDSAVLSGGRSGEEDPGMVLGSGRLPKTGEDMDFLRKLSVFGGLMILIPLFLKVFQAFFLICRKKSLHFPVSDGIINKNQTES